MVFDEYSDVQNIITIGSANEAYFQSIDYIYVQIDESYFELDWGHEPVAFLKALNNIFLMMNDDSKIRLVIKPWDFTS